MRMKPDDLRIPQSFEAAHEEGLDFSFEAEEIDGAHPNSVRVVMSDGKSSTEVVGASVGGGAVELQGVDGFAMNVPFGQPALITMHHDVPGVVAVIAGELYRRGLNLARMDLKRSVRGGLAVAVFVLDGSVAPDLAERIVEVMPACERAILLTGETEGETR